MNTLTAPSPVQLPARAPAAARTVFRLLQQLRHGSLTIELPDGSVQTVGDGQGPHISIHMHNWNAFGAALKSGDIGFAESYMAGELESSDITAVLRFYLRNREALNRAARPVFFKSIGDRLFHLLRQNTRAGARRKAPTLAGSTDPLPAPHLSSTRLVAMAAICGALAGCTVQVLNAGVAVARSGVNLLVRGY